MDATRRLPPLIKPRTRSIVAVGSSPTQGNLTAEGSPLLILRTQVHGPQRTDCRTPAGTRSGFKKLSIEVVVCCLFSPLTFFRPCQRLSLPTGWKLWRGLCMVDSREAILIGPAGTRPKSGKLRKG